MAAVVAGAIVLLGILGVAAVAVTLPGCESCHSQNAAFHDATVVTTHAQGDVSCVECHVVTDRPMSRVKFSVYQVFGMWLPLLDPAATDATLVVDSRCLACHQDVMADEVLEAQGIRVVHASCTEGRACVDCHSEVGHAEATSWPRVVSMNDCIRCHRQASISLECETCHTEDVRDTRSSDREFAVTHGSNWRDTHGMGEMGSCSVCHDEDKCVSCHGPGVPHEANFLSSHAEYSVLRDAECVSCHQETFCDGCHLTPMPHTRAFTRGHAQSVEQQGERFCLRCHASEDCETCHVTHVHPGGSVGLIPSPTQGGE